MEYFPIFMGDSELNNQGLQSMLLLMCRVDDHKATIKLGNMGPLPQASFFRGCQIFC